MAETTVLRSSAINRTPNGGAKPQAQLSGALPVVQVNMNSGGPQVQGGQGTVKQGVTLLPPKGARRTFTTGGLPNQPAKQGVVILPPKGQVPPAMGASLLKEDHLLLCRHLTDKYLTELRASPSEAQLEETTARNIKLAEETISTIDAQMVELTAAAAIAATAATVPPPPRAVSVGARTTSGQGTAVPRRVSRPGSPLPPVAVKMEDGQPVIIPTESTDHSASAIPRRVSRPTPPSMEPADQAESDAQG